MCSTQDLNKYSLLLAKVKRTKADISFLKQCKKHKVFPKFIEFGLNVRLLNSRTDKIKHQAKLFWMNAEIEHHYANLDFLQLQLYEVHLKITKNLYNDDDFKTFLSQQSTIFIRCETIYHEKRRRQYGKLERLIATQSVQTIEPKPCVENVSDLVVNLSNENFSDNELELLNRGLNFAIKPTKTPILDAIVDIESAIQYRTFDVKKQVRDIAAPVIVEAKRAATMNTTDNDSNKWNEALKSLKQRDVYYMKADKGNQVVVLNKIDYDVRMLNSIHEENFTICRKSPLNKMIKDAKSVIDILNQTFGVNKFHLREPNPQVPLMYGLPKIHKPGKK